MFEAHHSKTEPFPRAKACCATLEIIVSDFEVFTDVGAGAGSGSVKRGKGCFDDLSHYQSMRFVLATATSRIGVIRIGVNKVTTGRAACLAPAITDKQTKGGRCEGPCVIMNYHNNYDQHHPSCCHRCAEDSQPRCCRSRRTHCL